MENDSQIVIYQTPQGDTRIDVTLQGETIWLTQRQIADLFGTQRQAITKHLKNIYASGELEKDSTSSKMETVQMEGSSLFIGVTTDRYHLKSSECDPSLNKAMELHSSSYHINRKSPSIWHSQHPRYSPFNICS